MSHISREEYERHNREDARLVMLRALYDQEDDRLNQSRLLDVLKVFGYKRDINFVRTELRAMRELGAVILHEAGTFMVAEITDRGTLHVERAVTIDGIRRPSRNAG